MEAAEAAEAGNSEGVVPEPKKGEAASRVLRRVNPVLYIAFKLKEKNQHIAQWNSYVTNT